MNGDDVRGKKRSGDERTVKKRSEAAASSVPDKAQKRPQVVQSPPQQPSAPGQMQQPPPPAPVKVYWEPQGAYQQAPKALEVSEIDYRYMTRTKMGDGLSLASLIIGIVAVIFSTFGGLFYYEESPYFISNLIFPFAAIVLGMMGSRLQRMVTKKFGYGIAGVALGAVGLTTYLVTILTHWLWYRWY